MTVRSVSVPVDGAVLRGSLHLPEGDGVFPLAVLHHGFGSQRTEVTRLFVQLARSLNAIGIAAVAIDRAGHGESDGDFFDTTVSTDIRHAHHTLVASTSMEAVDSSRVHLVGMSMGGVVASVVAAETDLPVASLTMWCPAAVFVDEIRSGRLQGRSVGELDEQGWFDFHGMALGPSFFQDAAAFDVYGRARGYAGPVRILHGAADGVVPVRYAQAYADVYGSALDLSVVPDADHEWSSVGVRKQLVAETLRFLRSSGRAATPNESLNNK